MKQAKKSIDGLAISRPNSTTSSIKPTTSDVGIQLKQTKKTPAKPKTKSATKIKEPTHKEIGITKETLSAEKKRKAATSDFLEPVKTFDFDLTSDDIKPTRGKKNKKKAKKPWSKRRKILIITFSILLIFVSVILIWGDALIAKLTGGNSGIWDAFGTLWNDVPLKTDSKGRTNILAFGTSGYDSEGSEGRGTHDGSQLTDSIMVISIDQETKDVAMVNLPRDLKTSGACSAGKINEVYWCNNQNGDNEAAGATALEKSVSEVLGVDFQYYAHVNWGSLVEIVDSLGGITVTLDEDINDYMTKTYIRANEPTELDGERALGLARARHGTTGGDFSRGNSQQKILMAIASKVQEKGLDLTSALNLVNVLGDNLRTDFTIDEMKTMFNTFEDVDLSNIRQVPLVDYENNTYYVKTADIGGISFVVPEAGVGVYTDIHKYIAKMFSSDPAVREGANIMILNGSDTTGKAGTERDALEAAGYVIGYTGDADGTYDGNSIYVINEKMTGTKESLEDRYDVEAKTADELPENVYTTGYDIVIILGNTTE